MEVVEPRPRETPATLPFVEKYRPDRLDDVISQNDIVGTRTFPQAGVVKTFIASKRLPHMIFHGPPGTGKTSCILALAKALYGPHYRSMSLEVLGLGRIG